MKTRIAKWLVRWVSGWISTAYYCNHFRLPHLEMFSSAVGRGIQSFAFPIAKWLDEKAMVDQMVEECWWG